MSHKSGVFNTCSSNCTNSAFKIDSKSPQFNPYSVIELVNLYWRGVCIVFGKTFVSILLLAVIVILLRAFKRKRRVGEPPLVPGVPFLGCGRQFAKDPVQFMLSMRSKYGDIFTVPLPFLNLHLVMNPHLMSAFSRHPHLSFEPIQRMVNQNVFQFKLFDAKRIMKDAAFNARFSGGIPDNFTQFLYFINERLETLHGDAPHEIRLMEALGSIQFRAIYNSIFGNMDQEKLNHVEASRHFKTFHEYFTYLWLGFPLSLFPKAKEALDSLVQDFPSAESLLSRADLSQYMRHALGRMSEAGQPHAAIVGHNLVYLHVNCNTVKSTFWMLCHLLQEKTACAKLREEMLDLVSQHSDKHGNVRLSVKQVEQLPVLNSVVLETFRLCSGVFMVREVEQDTELHIDPDTDTKVKLRKGDKIAFYPPALHQDPEIFDSPQEFLFNRFVDRAFYFRNKLLRNPVWPFGSICPGQRLALLQMKLTAMTLLCNFDLHFAQGSSLPQYDKSTCGHEILSPLSDVTVTCQRFTNISANVFYKIEVDP